MDHWQTLIAGMGAVLAGAASVYYLRRQIFAAEEQEARRRKRRLAAARARMPLALSEATNYGDEALSLLKRCLDAVMGGRIPPDVTASRQVLPEQAIASFEAVIEATDDDAFAGVIASMISEMQVLDARLRGLGTERGDLGALNIQSYVLNAAKVSGYASSMFGYARDRVEVPPHELDWSAVFGALMINALYDTEYPKLHAFVARARDRALNAREDADARV